MDDPVYESPAAATVVGTVVSGPPRSSDLMRALAEVESRFPTHEWRVAGVAVWPLVRLRWFFREWAAGYASSAQQEASATGAARYAKQALAGAAAAAKARWRDPRAIDWGRDRRDLVYLSDGLSFTKLGGRWVERFCDPLIAAAKRAGLSSSLWTPLHLYHVPRYTPSRLLQCGIDRASMAGALHARRAAADSASLPAQNEVVNWMAAAGFGVESLRAAQIISDGWRVRMVANLHRRRLRRLRPRMAFIVSFYSVEGMAFVLACRECGIPVMDIQHGVQGEMHPAYAAWPRPRGDRHELLPDRFWVWSDWEADVIGSWSGGTGHSPFVGGNPWSDLWRSDSRWQGVTEAMARARALKDKAGRRSVVLITLQYGLSASEQLEGVAGLLRSRGEKMAFWVRLHPAMLERREEIRSYLGSAGPCELDECSDLPLQALLPHVDVHVTHSSSTVIDAAQFGVPSVITTIYGAEVHGRILSTGFVQVETGGTPELEATLIRLAAGGRRPIIAAPPADAALARLLADASIKA
ncbi:MAG: hypothetical protein JSR67_10555 [Proteobacteria bacterium]|nr:hypothetical protein [Pseudomonadota bacterium]